MFWNRVTFYGVNNFSRCWVARLILLLLSGMASAQSTQPPKIAADAKNLPPVVQVAFSKADPIIGATLSPTIALPMECTSDGTAFLNMPQLPDFRRQVFVSVSRGRDTRVFRLNEAPELHDTQLVEDFVSDSNVVLLVDASLEDKQVKKTFHTSDGRTGEQTVNDAERHFYAVIFDRDGKYKKSVQIDDRIRPRQIGLFPSGNFLVYGFDLAAPDQRLALLKADGTILEYLDIPENKKEKSLDSTSPTSSGGYSNPDDVVFGLTQFVAVKTTILVLSKRERMPLLEVSEAGAVRVIPLKASSSAPIRSLVSSDQQIYAKTGPAEISEFNLQDGRILGRFQLPPDVIPESIACVYQGKFLSFQTDDNLSLIPLIGTPIPAQ